MYMASALGQTISQQEAINEMSRRGYKKGVAPVSPSYSPALSADRVSPYTMLPPGLYPSKDDAISFAINWALERAGYSSWSGSVLSVKPTYLAVTQFNSLVQSGLSAAWTVNKEMGWNFMYTSSDIEAKLNQRGYYVEPAIPTWVWPVAAGLGAIAVMTLMNRR
jgi:hypothetical protein